MIYISVVSHGHFDVINRINTLPSLAFNGIKVLVVDNIGEVALKLYCEKYNLCYFFDGKRRGFGANNNLAFDYFSDKFDLGSEDSFICLNPDIIVSADSIFRLVYFSQESKSKLSTLNLYLDDNYEDCDQCIRKFPTFSDFFYSFIGYKNDYIINKNDILDSKLYVDWCAGSFLCFNVNAYEDLKGFDERYFMYCEDIDICYRFYKKFNEKVLFFKDIKGIHLRGLENRKVFSRHFYWHLKSIIRFVMMSRRFFKRTLF
ncbi:glycosyltransferase family 2 protein [Pseudoalteromonas sp. MEBiC 03485]|uniref:glycosyltransferase family 2 protein n=1 Tax=unclassified Pseudoalteromonas TaxID=194690 RepID=UPI00101F7C3E|nr:glycosyltransferase family 2 protein [Pseudoalteromonas sp. MEBiC 03485]RZD21697.1 glycosyltransferase family 2 protein [Pseudoalteromonas sp. MEBiC 03485]